MTFGDIEKFMLEIIHLDRKELDLLDEIIIRHQGRDCCCQPCGGRDQSLGNAGSDRLNARRMGDTEPSERVYDAPNRAEQANERCRACNGGEK